MDGHQGLFPILLVSRIIPQLITSHLRFHILLEMYFQDKLLWVGLLCDQGLLDVAKFLYIGLCYFTLSPTTWKCLFLHSLINRELVKFKIFHNTTSEKWNLSIVKLFSLILSEIEPISPHLRATWTHRPSWRFCVEWSRPRLRMMSEAVGQIPRGNW